MSKRTPEVGVYAIIFGDGPEWVHQAGGYACHQMTASGTLKEIRGDEKELYNFFTGDKYGGWCSDGIDSETADFIESVVSGFTVDRDKLSDCEEAWILGFVDSSPAVLIWGNSD